MRSYVGYVKRAARRHHVFCLGVGALLALTITPAAFADPVVITADKPSGVYEVGQTVHWTVTSISRTAPDDLAYVVAPNQGKSIASGTLSFSSGVASVDATFTEPSTILLKVQGKDADGKEFTAAGGAVAGINQIRPSADCPADFDAFWSAKLRELASVPVDAEVTPADAGRAGVKFAKITLANIRGTHIRGQLARPAAGEKFPAILIVQYAGVYPLQKSWVTDRAADGWLALNIEAHDLPIDEPATFYQQQFDGPLKNYWAIGNDNRETSYFLRMYLSCYRAAEYLASRPDWDGKTLVVMGGSQGGMQALVTAALNPRITAAMAEVPAGCDMLGPAIGRRGGWPQWYDWTHGVDWKHDEDAANVHQASRYFDVVNFASRIKCPTLVGTGLIDETCPAAGVIAAFNQIKAPKELVILPNAPHQNEHDSHAAYEKRLWGAWLPALLKGNPPPMAHGVDQENRRG